MQWVSIISGVIALLRWLVDQAEIRKAIDADRLAGLRKGMEEMNAVITSAKKARDDARIELDRDPDLVLRDDEFRRKDGPADK